MMDQALDLTQSQKGLSLNYFTVDEFSCRQRMIRPRPLYPTLKKAPLCEQPEEKQNRYCVSLNVTGVHPEDVAVVTSKDGLIVEIEKEFKPDKVANDAWDRAWGIFVRRFELPDDVDRQRIYYKVSGDTLQIDLYKKEAFASDDSKKGWTKKESKSPELHF